jgi:hypothetical protein
MLILERRNLTNFDLKKMTKNLENNKTLKKLDLSKKN